MQHTTRLLVAFAFIILSVSFCAAQVTTPASRRVDTILLSVYNTGVKYLLLPATFGPATTGKELVTEMVLVHDTIVRFEKMLGNGTTYLSPIILSRLPDSTRRVLEAQKLSRAVITRKCDKPITDSVKNKVVLMYLGTCDPTLMCLNAQRAGASAIVLMHGNNNRDSILLKTGVWKDSITIPCYTVRRDIGEAMSAMMPSQVGIKKPTAIPLTAQGLMSQTNNNASMVSAKDAMKTVENDDNTEGGTESTLSDVRSTNNPTSAKTNTKVQFSLSPNPANDMATLTFNLSKKTAMSMDILNEGGQLMYRKAFQNAEVGFFNFDTREWASGAYFLHLTDGKGLKVVKRLVVQH
jgi:Secretion system C-terminal sorting domain